jgi:hypothetical protein
VVQADKSTKTSYGIDGIRAVIGDPQKLGGDTPHTIILDFLEEVREA